MKQLPADVFVDNVVELLLSSELSVTLHHAKSLLKRSILKLPPGRVKIAAQAQLPQLNRLLKKKLQDVLPASETSPKRGEASIGSSHGFLWAVQRGGSLSALLQARLPAHPALLQRFLSQKDGAEFDDSILRILAASEAPDAGHVINYVCQRYSGELRRMSDRCITAQDDIVPRKDAVRETIQKLYFVPLPETDADRGRLKAICVALASIASLCPLHIAAAKVPRCILRNACSQPTSPVATLMFTHSTAQVLSGWQRLQKTWLTAHHFHQAIVDVKWHLQQLVAGLLMDATEVDSFLLQHPATDIDRCTPADAWAAVPSLAWLAMQSATSFQRHQACPSLSITALLLQRQCSRRHVCLGDSVASNKATDALAGRPCSAETCSWLTGLQQPSRFVSALKSQDVSHPNKLGGFFMRYPHTDDISQLQQMFLLSQKQESAPVQPLDDEGLFVIDFQSDPMFTGAWGSSGNSEDEENTSDEVWYLDGLQACMAV